MQRCAFTPYEGKKPYIFISYAHKDSHLVFPILEELDRRGYRVWYDDGIAPGSEWPENIAQHLDGCSLTMAFISPNSIASANCRREVTFALSKRKPFLGIVLQPTEMSLGMEMQLSAQQCIMKYTYASDEDFFRKVCACPDLLPCLGQPKAVPVAAPVSAAPVAQVAAPAPKAPAVKKPLDKKLIAILSGAVAAVALLAVVVGVVLGGGGDDGDKNLDNNKVPQTSQNGTTGQKPTQGEDTQPEDTGPVDAETYLYYADQVITAEDVEYISSQSQLEVLQMYNCTIQNNAFDSLTLANTVTEIEMENCVGVTNLHSLGDMECLMVLRVINCGITDGDMPKLSSTELYEVNISGNTAFSNLEIFADCTNIEYFDFSHTAVSSVNALAGMENLSVVNGSYTQVKELLAVANLTELQEVYFAGCGLETIGGAFYSLYLEKLDLSYNKLTNLEAFTYCTTLQCVDVSFNALEDVDVLAKSAYSLEELNLAGNTELYYFDVDILNSCTNLRKLTLDGIYMVDMSPICDLTQLYYLSMVDCNLIDISDLQNIQGLEYLNLALNRIDDISVLAEVANESMILDLSFNDPLKDVSALPVLHYRFLNLTNGYLDPYTIPLAYGDMLVVAYNNAWLDSSCMAEDNRSTFDRITMVACPLDKVVAMENRFGKGRIAFLQEDGPYLEMLMEWQIDCRYLELAFAM